MTTDIERAFGEVAKEETMYCDTVSCDKKAFCDSQWGSRNLPCQTATLCEEHSSELWQMLSPLLSTGAVWYRINRPGVLKNEIV